MDHKSFRRLLRREQTPAEMILWYALRAKRFGHLKFRRQHPIGKFTVDFYCPSEKLIIEVDGSVHLNPGQEAYDFQRDQYLKEKGFKILRVDNESVLKYLETVLEEIEKAVL